MAGYIRVNSENRFSISSVYFDAIINYSKPYLNEKLPEITKEIYDPIEEAGMFIFDLVDMPSETFCLIFTALQDSYDYCLSKGSCGFLDEFLYEDVMNTWNDVLIAIKNDVRFTAAVPFTNR